MKQITQRLIFCLALLLPALAGYADDITEDFTTNTDWMPATADSTPTNYPSTETGLTYTFYYAKKNSGYLMMYAYKKDTYENSYMEVTLPIDCSAIKVTTNKGSSESSALKLYAGETEVETKTFSTPGNEYTYDIVSKLKAAQPAGTKFKLLVTGKNTQLTKITFVEATAASSDPQLGVYNASYTLGTIVRGGQATLHVPFIANNLTENVSVSIDNDAFSLSSTSVAPENATDGIYVTLSPTEVGDYNATLTFTCGDLSASTALSATVPATTGIGTHDDPFTVADVILLNSALDQSNKYYVKGTISDKCAATATGGVLGTSTDLVNTNLVLTDGENNIGVQLKSATDRAALSISDNPGNVKGTLLVEGVLSNYFQAPGVTSITSNYELELYKEPAAVDHYVIYSADALAENEEQIDGVKWQTWWNNAIETVEDETSPEGAAQRLSNTNLYGLSSFVHGWEMSKEYFSATKLFTTTEEGSEAYDVVFMAKSSDASESYYVNVPDITDPNNTINYPTNFTLPTGEWTEVRIHIPTGAAAFLATDPDTFQVGIGANGESTANNDIYICDLHFEPADHSNDPEPTVWEAGKTFWGIKSGTTPFNGIDYPYYLRYSITTNEDQTLSATAEYTGLDALSGFADFSFSIDPEEPWITGAKGEDGVFSFTSTKTFDVDQTLMFWFYYPYTLGFLRTENDYYTTCSESEKPELPIQLVITADSKEVTDATAEIHYTVYPAALAENCTVTLEGAGTAVQNDGYFYVSGLDAQTEYSYTLTVSDSTDANAVDGTAAVTFSTQVKDGVDQISADSAAAEYYNLQGIRVTNPVQGQIYIRKQNQKATKVAF